MKKITLLITLMLSCFAFGQQILLQDFQTSSTFTFAGFEGLGKLTPNNVPPVEGAFIVADPASGGTRGLGLQLKSSALGNPWQGAEFVFTGSKRIRLTTDKTMKVDVYSTKAFTMLAKVESGTGPNSATPASYTTPNQWQTLTFTFNTSSDGTAVANGDYAKIVFFPGRNATNTGWATPSDFNVHVDNVTGVSATAAPDPAPTTAAPTPPARNAVDVISLFSNAYTNKTIENWSASYDSAEISDVVIAGNDTKKVIFSDFLGVQFTTPANRIDATPMTNFHIDLWIPSTTATLDKVFITKFSNWANGSGEANAIIFTATNASTPKLPTPNPGTWISLDIPLSSFSPLNGARNDIAEFIISSPLLGLAYIDNMYFWRDPLPAGTPTISFTIPAKSVTDPAFSLTPLITSNSPGAITYSSSNNLVATVAGSTVSIVGVGSTTITANQAAGGTYNAGSKTAVLDVNPIAAPIPPTVTPSSVIGLYGETYPVTGYSGDFGSVGTADLDTSVGVNNALKYNFANGGYGQTFATKDISAMGFVHFDYYTTDATTFGLYLISNSPTTFEAIYNVPNIVKNQWVGVNVPMSAFTQFPAFKTTSFSQFKFDVAAATPGIVYIDNLYFSTTNPALGTSKFETSKVKMYPNPAKNSVTIDANGSIERVSVYNILGQEVLSKKPNSNSTTLQTSGLQRGTYIVRSTIDGKTTTSKLIKE
ncbi:T9SS type A sorting domain-containing protein [Flavobacterium sp.]|uniref:T9SS type A sorting domain-containing protein n=1 Tax=Flavobacterium sp. TaxID=239 RepID=UPI0038FC4FAA